MELETSIQTHRSLPLWYDNRYHERWVVCIKLCVFDCVRCSSPQQRLLHQQYTIDSVLAST